MNFKSIISVTCACFSIVSFGAIANTAYEYADGQIIGVTGLVVNGVEWDMKLQDGSFDNVYAEIGNDAIVSNQFSFDAMSALFSFISAANNPQPGAAGFFGCESIDTNGHVYSYCNISTVDTYDITNKIIYGDYIYYEPELSVFRGGYVTSSDDNFVTQTYTTWRQTSTVPIPTTVWLFSSGIVALIGIAKRKKS